MTEWRLSAAILQLRQYHGVEPGSRDPTGSSAAGNDPKHQWLLRSQFNLKDDMDLDFALRLVAELPNPVVPAYTAVDARFAWRPRPGLEASVTAQNLLDARHFEFGAAGTARQTKRAVFLRLLWRD